MSVPTYIHLFDTHTHTHTLKIKHIFKTTNICLWFFIIHAIFGVQCLGHELMKKPFACGILVTSTGWSCRFPWSYTWHSSHTWLGFLFLFFPQASEQVWDFPLVTFLKHSPGVTKTPGAPGIQMTQDSLALD